MDPEVFISASLKMFIQMMIHAIHILAIPLLVLKKMALILIFHNAEYVKL